MYKFHWNLSGHWHERPRKSTIRISSVTRSVWTRTYMYAYSKPNIQCTTSCSSESRDETIEETKSERQDRLQ